MLYQIKKKIEFLKDTLKYFDYKLRRDLLIVILLSCFGAIFDTLSLVFLAILTGKYLNEGEISFLLNFISDLFMLNNIDSINIFYITVMVFFISSCFKILITIKTTKIAFSAGIRFTANMVQNTLSKSYIEIMNSNKNNAFAGIYKKSDEFILNLVLPIGVISGSLIMVFGIFTSVLFLVSSQILPLIMAICFLYILLFVFTHKRLKKNSLIISNYTNSCLEILKQIFGYLRDIKINSQEDNISNLFTTHNSKLKNAQAKNMIYAQIPRYIVEGFLVLIIFLLVLYFQSLGHLKEIVNVSDIIIIMFSGLKLIPLIQRMFWGISTITGRMHVLMDILSYIQPSNKIERRGSIFTKSDKFLVRLKNVSFNYGDKQKIISNFSFNINKNHKVLIKGSSGVGKSTLLDLIVGFLEPTQGKIERSAINNKIWLQSISFVSANSFFPNKKIGEVIHDGYKKYNQRKVLNLINVLGLKLSKFSEHETEVFSIGEDAEFLSYGQQRRLSIARALYKEPSLLIFDEATNGLDAKSESSILDYISSLNNLSLIFVSHKFLEKNFFTVVLDLDKNNE